MFLLPFLARVPDVDFWSLMTITRIAEHDDIVANEIAKRRIPYERVSVEYTLMDLGDGYMLTSHTYVGDQTVAEYPTAMAYLDADFRPKSYAVLDTGECASVDLGFFATCRAKAEEFVNHAFQLYASRLKTMDPSPL